MSGYSIPRYVAKKQRGECVQDGCKNPAHAGRVRCVSHLTYYRELPKNLERSKARYGDKKRLGLCVMNGCNAVAELGKVRCEPHLEQVRVAARLWRKTR